MAICEFARWLPVQAHGGILNNNLGLILHVQQGDGSPYRMFADPANEKSSTWWVSKTGVLEQYVDSGQKAWAQKAGNATYNSVETEGNVGEELTSAQVETLAHLYVWGHVKHGWPLQLAGQPGEHGLGTHAMGGTPWGAHPCPGHIRSGQRQQILDRANELLLVPSTPTSQEEDEVPQPTDIVASAVAPNGGLWKLQADGGVITDRGAPFYGSYPALRQGPRRFVSIATTADGYVTVDIEGAEYWWNQQVHDDLAAKGLL